MEFTDRVHGASTPGETPIPGEGAPTPGETPIPAEPAPTEPGTTDAPAAEPTPADPTAPEDGAIVEGDTPEPDVEINPTDGETGPVVDNQQGDPTGLPAESYEADLSDDKALPHDQDQA